MSKEAMQLALEALAVKFSEGWHEGIKIDASDIMLLNDAAQALSSEAKEQPRAEGALAQQEPFGFAVMENPIAPPAQQEPVGYVAENGVVDWNICAPPIMTDLYTAPPAQRTWVGLTDDEVDDAARYCVKSGQSVNAAIRAIEAKLKEKNT